MARVVTKRGKTITVCDRCGNTARWKDTLCRPCMAKLSAAAKQARYGESARGRPRLS